MNITVDQMIELYNHDKHVDLEYACQQFLTAQPDHAYAWHLAAANAMQLGDMESALLRVEKAVALLPEEITFLNTQGTIFRQLGKMHEACLSYQKALEADPENIDTIYNLANLFRDTGEYKPAIAYYSQVLKSDAEFFSSMQ